MSARSIGARMGEQARRTQRLGSYVVVFRADQVLLTRISPVGYPAGWWTLPGGGVDHGESPIDAAVRELHEETGLRARSVRLVDVHDVHVVDRGRDDRYEDYHGVHLLFAADVDVDAPLEVVDVDGSTDRAAWVPIADVRSGEIGQVLPMVTHAVQHRHLFEA